MQMSGAASNKLSDLHPSYTGLGPLGLFHSSQRPSGSLQQKHRTPSKMPAFSRRYIPGDPVRLIDWRAFARTDSLLIREQREESAVTVQIVLTAHDSMQWPTPGMTQELNTALVSKFEVASRIALNLAYHHLNISEHVHFYIYEAGEKKSWWQAPIRNTSDVLQLFEAMTARQFLWQDCTTHFSPIAADELGPHDFNYFISDFLAPSPSDMIAKKRAFNIHLLSSLESQTDWLSADFCYFDENGEVKEYLGQSLQTEHALQQQVTEWRRGLEKNLRRDGQHYVYVNEQTPIPAFFEALMVD